jgi:peptidoglycan/LPS O-acetylase OafA/YrhL
MGIIRLLLALSVVYTHTGGIFHYSIVAGDVAVQCFFIVSGFYMTMILNEKYKTPQDNMLFFSNRLLRIFSIYWLFLIFAIPANILSMWAHKPSVFERIIHSGLPLHEIIFVGFANLFILGQDVAVFLPPAPSGSTISSMMLIPPAWSLALELVFYAIAPFIVRRSVWTAIAIIVLAVAARIYMSTVGFGLDPWISHFFPFEIALFLAGSVSYRLLGTGKAFWQQYAKFLWPIPVLAIVLYPLYGSDKHTFFTVGRIAILVGLCLLLPAVFKAFSKNKLDRTVGELSYPVYLCHLLIASILTKVPVIGVRGFQLSITTTIISVIVSIVVLKLVDEPIDVYRQRRAQRKLSTETSPDLLSGVTDLSPESLAAPGKT